MIGNKESNNPYRDNPRSHISLEKKIMKSDTTGCNHKKDNDLFTFLELKTADICDDRYTCEDLRSKKCKGESEHRYYFTTKLTIFPGTYISFTSCFPSSHFATFSLVFAFCSTLSFDSSTAIMISPLSFPRTCTPIVISLSTTKFSSYSGHGAKNTEASWYQNNSFRASLCPANSTKKSSSVDSCNLFPVYFDI